MSLDIYFNVASWFPGNFGIKFQFFLVQLSLSGPVQCSGVGEEDYVHHITTCLPNFQIFLRPYALILLTTKRVFKGQCNKGQKTGEQSLFSMGEWGFMSNKMKDSFLSFKHSKLIRMYRKYREDQSLKVIFQTSSETFKK